MTISRHSSSSLAVRNDRVLDLSIPSKAPPFFLDGDQRENMRQSGQKNLTNPILFNATRSPHPSTSGTNTLAHLAKVEIGFFAQDEHSGKTKTRQAPPYTERVSGQVRILIGVGFSIDVKFAIRHLRGKAGSYPRDKVVILRSCQGHGRISRVSIGWKFRIQCRGQVAISVFNHAFHDTAVPILNQPCLCFSGSRSIWPYIVAI